MSSSLDLGSLDSGSLDPGSLRPGSLDARSMDPDSLDAGSLGRSYGSGGGAVSGGEDLVDDRVVVGQAGEGDLVGAGGEGDALGEEGVEEARVRGLVGESRGVVVDGWCGAEVQPDEGADHGDLDRHARTGERLMQAGAEPG